ncbi:hypothetical protein TNCV_3069871 [Trichonephila clavipes]|nr:hypothetical protein TNCV_3069871 [Trichonephila clavipes]
MAHVSTTPTISTRDFLIVNKKTFQRQPNRQEIYNICRNWLEKQPSLNIVQKLQQKQFSSVEKGYAAAHPSENRKLQRT